MSKSIDLAYIQRVLESSAPQEDRDRAAQMMRDMRRAAMRSDIGELGAQPVAYWAAVNKDCEIEYSCNADDANDGEFARDMCNQHINGRLNDGGTLLRLKPLYGTQTAEIARLSAALSVALAQLEEERARNAADELDAARWRGLLGCARIRPLGSAGLENPEPGFYAHMGLEVWTTFSRNYSPKLLADLDIENERGQRWLTRLADVAIEAQALAIIPGAKP